MRLLTWLLAAFALVWAGAANAASITQDKNSFRLEGADIRALKPVDYAKVFKVGVDGQAAMAGRYRLDGNVLVFTAAFPLTPGVSYRAEFRMGDDAAVLRTTLPKEKFAASTVVTRVTPTASRVPENLLKLYIHFSAPMSRGDVYTRVHLFDQSGKEVNSVFLQIGQELWDPQQMRLTLLFDPGRIKRGLVSQTQLGMALAAGRTYMLVIDKDWKDARGVPLKQAFRKTFTVGPADRTALNTASWKITAPKPGGRAPVILDFGEALDEPVLEDSLKVTDAKGTSVPGSVRVSRDAARWEFVPATAWRAGAYRILAPSSLEDLAGNKIGSPFDVDVKENPNQRMQFKTYTLNFRAE